MAEEKKRRFFGTDGVRDIANSGMMRPEPAMKLGAAYALFLRGRGAGHPVIAVGRDTRRSGEMLQSALMSGIASAGGSAVDLGVIPTPGVSSVASRNKFDGGAVISASHNPAEYNGIKFLDKDGFKLTDDDEADIEAIFLNEDGGRFAAPEAIGGVSDGSAYRAQYADRLRQVVGEIEDTSYPIVIDAANGAASDFVEPLFAQWRGGVTFMANRPDGLNINKNVGVTHIGTLASEVVRGGAALGIAYDGDTDRVLLCDSRGRTLDGDIMLWVIGRWFAKRGVLGAGVTATVMSNMVLEDLLAEDGIKVFRCPVGDRYVLDTMRREGGRIGGEQSGHIIALEYANTGDGLCAGILFLKAVAELGEDISTLADRFERYPQVLRNMRVDDKDRIMTSPLVGAAAEEAERLLKGRGRMLLRPSGTEPLIRIFAESRDAGLMNQAADIMEAAIKKAVENHD
ncbi:phosphoglucosamine mutase [Cloacibacillus evryensis]|uniref:phosphoglucosamine mutase n=1 Tax=Cloacibacillus evryensis TaxID=508460 RepID=UPI0026729B38|nr:phosphoglucosamine mutase [Cloacibacillus evryensis]